MAGNGEAFVNRCFNREDPITLDEWTAASAREDVITILQDPTETKASEQGHCYERSSLIRALEASMLWHWIPRDPREPMFGRPDKSIRYFKLPLTNQWITESAYHSLRNPKFKVFELEKRGDDLIGSERAVSRIHGARELIYDIGAVAIDWDKWKEGKKDRPIPLAPATISIELKLGQRPEEPDFDESDLDDDRDEQRYYHRRSRLVLGTRRMYYRHHRRSRSRESSLLRAINNASAQELAAKRRAPSVGCPCRTTCTPNGRKDIYENSWCYVNPDCKEAANTAWLFRGPWKYCQPSEQEIADSRMGGARPPSGLPRPAAPISYRVTSPHFIPPHFSYRMIAPPQMRARAIYSYPPPPGLPHRQIAND